MLLKSLEKMLAAAFFIGSSLVAQAGQPFDMSAFQQAQAAGKSILHKVTATSSWDDYQTSDLGELELPAGEVRLTLKPASRPLPALADVKSLTLTPKRSP